MSLYLPATSANQPFPGVEVINIGAGHTPESFSEFAQTLTIPDHISMVGENIAAHPAETDGMVIVASRTQDNPRDPWAPDHHWHADRSYWGKNPLASVLYAKKLIGEVAATGIIDTTLLLETIEADRPGTVEELQHSLAVFSVRRYYEEILPVKGSDEAIQDTLNRHDVATLEQVIEKETVRYPEKTFPAIAWHPFRGEACLMGDDSRLVRYEGLRPSISSELIELIRDEYLNLPVEELEERPYHYLHQWEEGQALIYPQVGTLHRAMPSPAGEVQRDTLRLFIG